MSDSLFAIGSGKSTPDQYKNPIGMMFKTTIDKLFTNVFTFLREMKIIWKPWNSNYVYKCQTGVPIEKVDNLTSKKEKLDEFLENDLLKFFVQFMSVPRKREAIDLDTMTRNEVDYLV